MRALFVVFILACLTRPARSDTPPPAPPAPRCPHDGGPPWSETRTPHIQLDADVAPERLAPLATELERIRAEMVVITPLVLLGQRARIETPIQVTAFRDAGALPALTQIDLAGVQLGGRIAISDDGKPEIMRHELTHAVMLRVAGTVPRWLNEGVAEYLSSVALVDGRLRVGDIPERIAYFGGHGTRAIAGQHIPTLPELLSAPNADFDHNFGVYYVAAWTLVHLVNNERPEYRERFRAYVEKLAGGTSPSDAWRASFAPVESVLAQQYDEFLANICQSGTFETRTNLFDGVAIPAWSGTPSPPRPLADGDVHALWSYFDRAPEAERIASARAALAHDDHSADLHYQLYLLEREQPELAEADLAALATVRPDDERLLRSRLQRAFEPRPDGARLELARFEKQAARLERNCREPESLAALAAYWLRRGSLMRAFDFARRGIDSDHACAACWLTLTIIYVARAQPGDARRALGHALAQLDRSVPLPAPIAALRDTVARLPRR